MAGVPPLRASAYAFNVCLVSQADTDIFKVNPTLAVGDVKVSLDGGALNNVTDLPTVIGAGKLVNVTLTAAEMTADRVMVVFCDAAGDEWQDLAVLIETETAQINDLAQPGDAMTLEDDAITSAKYDESTAFPVKAADTGASQIARVGADGDTLETLSDQLDTAQADLDAPNQYKADVAALAIEANVEGHAADALTAWDPPTQATMELALAGLNDLSAAEVNAQVVDALTVDVIADSVSADGSRPTIAQALYEIVQFLQERAVSGTTVTVKKPDGTTSLMTLTLDDATSPTSITRAS